VKEFNPSRNKSEYEFMLGGERFTAVPAKQSAIVVPIVAADGEDDFAPIRGLIHWFEKSLNREHVRTRKQPGHGAKAVEGCQACRLSDRLEDEDDDLDTTQVIEAANWLQGEVSGKATGSSSG
jgi:hypothetical protein